PTSGVFSGGYQATISGTNFNPNTATVTIGGVGASVVVASSSSTALTVNVPNLSTTGLKNVTVNNNDGSTPATVTNLFNATSAPAGPAPTISFPQPGNGHGGDPVTIFGSNFQQGATVLFGSTPAVVTSVSSNSVAVLVPTLSQGNVNLTV